LKGDIVVTLNLEKRDKSAKGRQLRNRGIIPAVLYGKHLEESVCLQLPVHEAERFLQYNFIGSKVEIVIGKEKHLAALKEATYTPGAYKLEHLSFQALVAGEVIRSVARVIINGREKVREGVLIHMLDEIAFSALPADLVDRVEVDVSHMKPGDVLTVEELDIAKNEKIELITPLDSVVVTVTIPKVYTEEEEAETTDVAEPALVSDKEEE
jgi:large subunit ribosomal protein L25